MKNRNYDLNELSNFLDAKQKQLKQLNNLDVIGELLNDFTRSQIAVECDVSYKCVLDWVANGEDNMKLKHLKALGYGVYKK